MSWHLPVTYDQQHLGIAGPLIFVGGAGDFDQSGVIRSPQSLDAQIAGALDNVLDELAIEGCNSADIVRIKAFIDGRSMTSDHAVVCSIQARLGVTPPPVLSLHLVVMNPWPGQRVQLQVIAMRNWRKSSASQIVSEKLATELRDHGMPAEAEIPEVTTALRAGEFVAIAPQLPTINAGAALCDENGIAQTHQIMTGLEHRLASVGASLQDSIKKEGYYFGTDLDQWASMAEVRAAYFREPGPVATVVPCHQLLPRGAVTKVEILAMRERRATFDKYIARDDRWPTRVWDWPIPVPYRQGIRIRDMIWTGGQVPFAPAANEGHVVYPGDLIAQTKFTMRYLADILRAYQRDFDDLALLVCYFASDGMVETTHQFVEALATCCSGSLPPLTLIPQPHMHSKELLVEIWGVARG